MTDYAALAQSLKDNEAFQEALDKVRIDALDTLATVKREDEAAFYTAQATVKVVDELREKLRLMIAGAAAKKPPGIA